MIQSDVFVMPGLVLPCAGHPRKPAASVPRLVDGGIKSGHDEWVKRPVCFRNGPVVEVEFIAESCYFPQIEKCVFDKHHPASEGCEMLCQRLPAASLRTAQRLPARRLL